MKQALEKLSNEYREGLFPVVEVELNAGLTFEYLLSAVTALYDAEYKILKADIEYYGNTGFGKVLLMLKGNKAASDKMNRYFTRHNIKNSIKGYA